MYLDEAKELAYTLGVVQPGEASGCTQEEIAQLEQKLQLPLPAAYKEFLSWMGGGAGEMFQGTECFYGDVYYGVGLLEPRTMNQAAIELLEENDFPRPLPDDAFVFLMHQGYQFLFLRTTEGEDPPIYYYNEGHEQDDFILYYKNMNDMLVTEVRNIDRVRKYINSLKK